MYGWKVVFVVVGGDVVKAIYAASGHGGVYYLARYREVYGVNMRLWCRSWTTRES